MSCFKTYVCFTLNARPNTDLYVMCDLDFVRLLYLNSPNCSHTNKQTRQEGNIYLSSRTFTCFPYSCNYPIL